MANTQSYNLPLIQLVSLGGVTAVAFLMSWGAALGETALASALPAWRRHAAAFGIVFLLVNAYGVLRLERRQAGPESQGFPSFPRETKTRSRPVAIQKASATSSLALS